jgi:hypothetical protein
VNMLNVLRHVRIKVSDRRRAVRLGGPSLMALYWTGGAPCPYRVRDIHGHGAYIETKDHWCAGSVIYLVLEHNESCQPSARAAESLGLWIEIVRVDASGMGVEFIMMDQKQERKLQQLLEANAGEPGREKRTPQEESAGV